MPSRRKGPRAAIEQAVDAVVARGVLTPDLGGAARTEAVTAAVLAALET
jgi:isocitrate/isopropylmalate dehydrogenase